MDWKQARDATLEKWTALRDSVGEAATRDLLVEINAVVALCEKANEEAGDDPHTCRYCIFYDQFGGCRGISAEMSERAAARDWQGLGRLVDRFLDELRALRLPPEAAGDRAAVGPPSR